MIYLLDVSTLVALLLENHVHNPRVEDWAAGKKLAVCPIVELGFLRISVGVYKTTMEQARTTLEEFKRNECFHFVPANLSALDGLPAPDHKKSTDWYLANLAQAHGMKWATLDAHATHPAAELVLPLRVPH